MSLPKNNGRQFEIVDIGGIKQNIYCSKGLMRAIQKCNFY